MDALNRIKQKFSFKNWTAILLLNITFIILFVGACVMLTLIDFITSKF